MSKLNEEVADFLKVLGDQTRLEILELLKKGPKTSEAIQTALEKSQSTISQHLKKLSDKDLILSDRKENINNYKIKNDYIFKILNFVQSFVLDLQKERLKDISELDIYDTLGI